MRISFEATIEKFDQQGEKTGWTFFLIGADAAQVLNPDVKVSYRVKGFLDQIEIKQVAIIPMGNGEFILPLNAGLRKQLKKLKGHTLTVNIEVDDSEILLNQDFVECLQDDVAATNYFNSLPKSHQNYYSKYIDSAKTDSTKAKRIAQVIHAMSFGMSYPEMLRAQKKLRE